MFNEILEAIKAYDKIFIFGHVRPDGDCYGSQFGLKEIILENFGHKEVHVVGDTSDYVSFLGTPEKIENDAIFHNSLAIVVDCGAADRVSNQRYLLTDKVIKIDHHIADVHYGDIVHVEQDCPACSQIIAKMAIENNLSINDKAAFALYTGIVTDTGRFSFRGVSNETFMIAAALIEHNVDVEKLNNYLSVDSLEVVKFKGYVLQNAVFTENGVVYIKITRDVIEQYGISDEDAAAQVGVIGNIENYPIYLLFMDYPNEIRIRIRSRGPRIDKIANKYGGGGHEKAAGARLASWEQLPEFIKDIDALNKYYQETGKDDLF